ncbi:MAG: hypothetical protein ABIP89_23435 [Polyangiaceae bacterium]
MKSLSRLSVFAVIALIGSHVHAAPTAPPGGGPGAAEKPTAAGESSQAKPAAERSIQSGPTVKPTGHADASHPAGTSPVVRGPRIPEEMRAHDPPVV